MNKEVVKYLENELSEFEKEINKTSEIMVNVMLNCGKDDIAVDECLKTIKYYKNKKLEVIKLLKAL